MLGDDDNLTSTKPPIDNDDSDINVAPTDVAPHVSEAVVTSTLLEDVVDYDEISVHSTQDNEVLPQTLSSEPALPHSEEAAVLLPNESLKRRKIDLGQLMVKSNVTKRAGSGRPLSQFKAPKRPEITRLPEYDDNNGSPTITGKVVGKGSGKDGRPIVADLVRLRESEARLAQELADEKAKAQAQLQAALAAQEAEFAKRLERMDPLTKANVPETQTLSLVDDRLSIDKTVSTDSNETPEKPKRILKRPLPDDDDLRSLGSYHKPIPKKLKEVDRLRQQHDLELKQLRNEIQLLRTEQRRMSHDSMSQSNASVRTEPYISKRNVTTAEFYGFPQRNVDTSQGSLHATDLNVTPTPVQTGPPRPIDQRNVMTTSQTSQPRQPSGMTV